MQKPHYKKSDGCFGKGDKLLHNLTCLVSQTPNWVSGKIFLQWNCHSICAFSLLVEANPIILTFQKNCEERKTEEKWKEI